MMQRLKPRLALTLLCVLLLVNDGFSSSIRQARAIEDPLLPPVVPIESATSNTSVERDLLVPAAPAAAAPAATTSTVDKPIAEAPSNNILPPTNVEASKSSSDGGYQSSEDPHITKKLEDASGATPLDTKGSDTRSSFASKPASDNTSKQADGPQAPSAEAAVAPSEPAKAEATAATRTTTTQEKDLKSLLENKNDAENDLASSPTAATGNTDSAGNPRKSADDVPVSVVAESDKPNLNNDRFHYSLGGADNADKQPAGDKALDSAAPKDKEEDTREPDQEEADEEDKRKQAPEKKNPVPDEDPAATTTTPGAEQPESSTVTKELAAPVSPAAGGAKRADKDQEALEPMATAGGAPAKVPTNEASKPKEEAPVGAEAAAAVDKPAAKPADAPAKDTKIVTDQSSKSDDSTTAPAEQPAAPSETTTTSTPTTTTTTPVPTTSAAPPVVKSDEPKRAEAPQQSATPQAVPSSPTKTEVLEAAAAAAGAAAGSALANGLAGKDKPVVASAPESPTTFKAVTAAPSSKEPSSSLSSSSSSSSPPPPPTASSTTRKSSTNRWNTWSTTSSSTSSTPPPPSTRRRPILPSIRRRFRPYNVFPWAMPESYSPLEPAADTEPMFGRPAESGSTPSSSASPSKPKRRGGSTSTTTTAEPSSTSSTSKYSPERGDEDDDTPTVSTRRRVASEGAGGSKRRHHHHHRHHHKGGGHHYHTNRDRLSPENGESTWTLGGGDTFVSQLPPRRQHFDTPPRPSSHHGARPWHSSPEVTTRRSNKHNHDEPFPPLSSPVGPLDPFGSPNRPQSGFGLFNSAAGSPSSGAGSGFDLLNPFSWIDEVTKPRPSFGSSPMGGGARDQSSFRPTPSHIGAAARPSGQRPVAFEGEFNEAGGRDEPYNHHHDHHHNHRPHGGSAVGRPLVGGGSSGHGRDDYDDYHDCHGHGSHGHDHDGRDRDHDHHGPYPRPPYRPTRPGRDDYDDSSAYGSRPVRPYGGRPYNRRDENASETSTGSHESEAPVRNRESSRSGERLESGSSASSSGGGSSPSAASGGAGGPHRVPSSVFSPFDTLFGSLDDDLFGGLRSSFIDSPLKAAAETIRQTNNAAFDAIISSPKISLPSSGQQSSVAGQASGGNLHKQQQQQQALSEPHSARVIMARVESNEPAIESTGKPSQVSSDTVRKSAIKEFFEQIENLRKRREQLLLTSNSGGGSSNNNSNSNNNYNNTGNNSNQSAAKAISLTPTPPPSADLADNRQHDPDIKPRAAELPPPLTTFRGGIKHFLMLI